MIFVPIYRQTAGIPAAAADIPLPVYRHCRYLPIFGDMFRYTGADIFCAAGIPPDILNIKEYIKNRKNILNIFLFVAGFLN